MIWLLSKWFIKDRENVQDNYVREQYGRLTGIVGILLNLLISAAKITFGILTGALAVLADGINNVTDAGSSIITMVSFRLANKPEDGKHPFGHGRIEYVCSLIVALIVVVVGAELAIQSIETLIAPGEVALNVATLIILGASVLVKVYMFAYNYIYARKINSLGMKATAMDSLCDAVSTGVVLLCSGITYGTGVVLDGYAGLAVACFIVFTGCRSAWEVVQRLIGEAPDAAFVTAIADYVRGFGVVKGIHDLVVHNYGEGRCMISLHVEVDAHGDIMSIHDEIDNIEHGLQQQFKCHAVIHMDPILADDEYTRGIRAQVEEVVKNIDAAFTIHDFRMNQGPTHTNLIFDVVITAEKAKQAEHIKQTIADQIKEIDEKYCCVIDIDLPYA